MSPDRTQIAFGISAPAAHGRIGIRIVDRRTLRTVTDVQTGIVAEALGWLALRPVVALLAFGDAVVVDPKTGDVLTRLAAAPGTDCFAPPSASTAYGFGVLVPGRFVLVDERGNLRAAPLARLRGRCTRGGLALDTARQRVFAVGGAGRIAEIDLATMDVRYHRVSGLPTGRRTLVWLGHGRLAVAGRTGVALIQTQHWTARLLDARATAVRAAGRTLLAFGRGVRAYTHTGRKRFGVAGGDRIWDVAVAGNRAYVFGERALRVVNLRRGTVTGRFPPVRDEIDLIPPR